MLIDIKLKKHEYGVGFLVHKNVVGAVLGCQQSQAD